MERLLLPYSNFLPVHFVDAVDGQQLSLEKLDDIWDTKNAYRNYGRQMGGGEIACALSHRKCYEGILKRGDEVALILEDDICFQQTDLEVFVSALECEIKKAKEPTVILLSGDFWWIRKYQGKSGLCLAKVYEAMGAIGYAINRKAAEIMITAPKEYLADDWYRWRKRGVRLYAIYPHMIDTCEFDSNIGNERYLNVEFRRNLSLYRRFQSYYQACIRQTYGRILGHFEARQK